MKIQFNQNNHNTFPPVTQISVNKSHVAYTDSKSKKKIKLASPLEARKFINWLLSLPIENK